jgi:hypothetical protein
MQLMKKIILVSVLLLASCLLVLAQKGQTKADEARAAVCRQVTCREATTITLKINNREFAEYEFQKGPYVVGDYINLLAGEEINVEFDVIDNVLSNARYVAKISAPEKTISLKLEQTDKGTVLAVNNPFAKNILYDCLIQHYKAQGLKQTSITPVPSRLVGFELWPYPIPQVVINKVRFVDVK